MISDGELNFLWERPITLAFASLAVLLLISPLISTMLRHLKTQKTSLHHS
ncbi:putative tricarboxylic transport membrane protein [Vibrio gazogenes DSM 21264]|uniref:Putative tricarboxylic transport membrane protein n=1 Tax=Vibrio gazogenes DSM 21264 = NBRC 103151 TaxID=1123492 RepID=A0A1M4YZ82_VIBGA|nr:putative tricarboxylic transport membrane protein [Vibrio gazogenes DSM 21264] [Vibrio gazogenes DSM 21264 = NBRC 103151]